MLEKRKEYIDQIISDLNLLSERAVSVRNNDSLPFSFFKESFDQIQKISKLLHRLEFMQIDDMRGQMERLVFFLSETENRVAHETAPIDEPLDTVSPADVPPIVDQPLNHAETNREEVAPAEQEEVAPGEQENEVLAEQKQGEKGNNQYTRGIVLPEYKNPNLIEKSPSIPPRHVPIEKKTASLNDTIPVHPSAVDLKQGISLNDRFLYQRELFRNDRQEMNRAMQTLSMFKSYEEAEEYLKESQSWDFDNPTVNDFLQVIKGGFE